MTGRIEQIYVFGPFRLDTAERVLLRGGSPVALPPKAFEVLLMLVERSGHVVEKDDLMNRVWADSFVEEGNLKVTVSVLRKTLEDETGQRQFIETVPRRGYRFLADVRELSHNGQELLLLERSRAEVIIEEQEETSGLEQTSTRIASSIERFVNAIILHKRGLITVLILSSIAIATIVYAAGRIFSWRHTNKQATAIASRPIPFQQITIKRLPVNGDPSGGAVLSPDGRLFAYAVMNNEGRETLWLGHVDGGEPVQLRPPADLLYMGMTFSPDGSSLYYTVSERLSSRGVVYRLPVFGGVAEKVKENIRHAITFSPDGQQFTFVRNEGSRSVLVIADTKGTAERELTVGPSNLGFFQSSPSWSPDGSMIAIGALDDENGQKSEVFVVSLADGGIKQLTATTWEHVRRTQWLNDSSGLVVVASDQNALLAGQLWHVR